MDRLLVVKLADLGDALTATPALRALRRAHPAAHITVLTTANGRPVFARNPNVDAVLVFPKAQFDRPAAALRPSSVALGLGLARQLRAGRFDAVALLHHLTTAFGTAKYAALALATGAPVRAGLDNGRGWFLTHRAADLGFGVQHEVEYAEAVATLLDAAPDGGPLDFPVTADEAAFAAAALPAGGPPPVAVHPGSGAFSPARRWPVARFQRVAAELAQRGYPIVVVGGPGEGELAAAVCHGVTPAPINLAERTALGELAAVLARCSLFIGSDSGVMHLAAAAGAPVLAVFGPSNAQAWGPWPGRGTGARARVLRVDLPCAPCVYTGHDLGTPQGCPARTCLHSIGPDDVIAAATAMLAQDREAAHA